MTADAAHGVCVFAPILTLTVTIEPGPDEGVDEIHVHPGGQGFWIARMIRHLGETPLLCGPVGGESGNVIRDLIARWGIDLACVEMTGTSPATVQDRRSGEREMVAQVAPARLARHEFDDAYGTLLDAALRTRVCVVTGQTTQVIPTTAYRRLGHDLGVHADVQVIADLHGPELLAFLEGGPIDLLKVSDEDLRDDGLLVDEGGDHGSERHVLAAIDRLGDLGAGDVVVSRGDRPAIARIGGQDHRLTVPQLDAADFRGAGDSMTAGFAVAIRRGLDVDDMLRLGCGAGAANATRHGLGSACPDLIEQLAERVEVERIEPVAV